MEAICKADYDKRIKARWHAENLLEQAKKNGKPTEGITLPIVGFHDFYGVWFSGQLIEIVREVGRKMFKVDLEDSMHVYTDLEPKKVDDGIHEIMVHGHVCRLYKWTAQGYNRGLVVLANDMPGNERAEKFRQSGTWSWRVLSDNAM